MVLGLQWLGVWAFIALTGALLALGETAAQSLPAALPPTAPATVPAPSATPSFTTVDAAVYWQITPQVSAADRQRYFFASI